VYSEDGFGRFHFHPSLVRGLQAAGFEEPRPIQTETIPAAMEGDDVMGLAQTGTGKTAAFALPILQHLIDEPGEGPLVLILAPTRELAAQIDAEIRTLARYTKIRSVTVFGGVPAARQIRELARGPEIVVGCPGRVLDLVRQRRLDVRDIDTLVLDEADHMFDLGFLPDIERILAELPRDRQNLLFSATMPKEIRRLVDKVLYEPHVVELANSAPAEQIDHALYPVSEFRKKALLERLLAEPDCKSAIVFTRTKHRAKRLADQLSRGGAKAVALQGNMSQSQRDRAMKGFRSGNFEVLVATDIAARGLDVAGIDYVINYDPPDTPDTYTHRIGRTGRSGLSGKACTFVTHDDRAWVRDTERSLGSQILRRELDDFDAGDGEGRGPAKSRGGRSGSRSTGRAGKPRAQRAGRASEAQPKSRRGAGGKAKGKPKAGGSSGSPTSRSSRAKPRRRR